MKTPSHIYVIEFKLNHSAKAALQQIKNKDYVGAYQTDSRQKVLKKTPDSVFDLKNFTERTHMLVNVLIPSEEEGNLALRRIQKYCDYACQHMDDKYSERIIFALLKCSIRSGSFQEKDFSDALAEYR